MEVFNLVLDKINVVICAIVSVAFISQIIYILLFFLPKKKYPPAKEKHRVGIIIPAKDEAEIIARTIQTIQSCNYPKDKFQIIVLADNCTDNTAQIARDLNGDVKVRVFERHETDKKKHNVGYALKFLFEQLMPEIDDYDFFIRFDADSIVDPEYINKMNDAFESGVLAAKGYNHASNLTQNLVAGVSGLWYIRDNRFNCHARAALNTDVFLVGGGMMFSAQCIKEDGGWICTSTSEDTQFTILNMNKKRKNRYVADAIVYEDQPSRIRDLFRRNVRMGNGLNKLFWKEGTLSLFKFFTTFRYCYLDMFFNLLFIPIAALCCLWFPLYYGYVIFFNWLSPLGDITVLFTTLKTIGIIMLCAFLVPFILQALLAYCLDRKKINKPFKKMIMIILTFPLFMIIYAIGVVVGIFSKLKWKKAKRNIQIDT